MSKRPRIAVVFERGAASPWEIGTGLADVGDAIFLVSASSFSAEVLPLLEEMGEVVQLTGDPVSDSAVTRKLGADGILTYSEHMLRATALIAERAGLRYHSPELARLLTNKVAQRQVLRAAGVERVRSHPLYTAADWPEALTTVGLPAVLKPCRGAASFNTNVVTTEQQALDLLPSAFAVMDGWEVAGGEPVLTMEEYLPGRPSQPYGDYVSVESMCTARGVFPLAITGKLPMIKPFRETGHFWPSQLPAAEQEEIRHLVTAALTALGVRSGIAQTEVKLTADGPRIIEVNGRLGGFVSPLSLASCGVDLVQLAARLAVDDTLPPPVLAPREVHYQWEFIAPLAPCRLEAIHGQREVLGLPGVASCRSLHPMGRELPGGVLTSEVFLVSGVTASHDDMIATVEQVKQALAVDLRFADGLRRVTAGYLLTEPLTALPA